MKIAYVLPAFPDPYTPSGHLRPYHFIRELSQRHSITLFSLTAGEISSAARREMANWTERILTFAVNGFADDRPAPQKGNSGLLARTRRAWRTRQTIGRMKASFADLTRRESYDVVVFQGKHTFPVIAGCRLPTVIDFCDATSYRMRQSMRYAGISELPWRLLRYLEVKHFERKLLGKSRHRAFISGRDRAAILGPGDHSPLIPNGIDLAYWTRKERDSHACRIVYTGVMEYPPNADGAFYLIRKIVPILRRSMPNLEVLIVGRNPSAELREAARQAPGVTVTGFVDDMRPYLESATVYVAPLRFASGMQNKLLEAMAMEVPVVTTPIGEHGIQVERGGAPPVRVAEGEANISQAISDLMHNKEERLQMAAAGRRYVEEYFDWSRSAAELEKLCLEAVAPAAREPESTREAICFSK